MNDDKLAQPRDPASTQDDGVAALLRTNPSFARLWVAQLISFAGDWISSVAMLGLLLDLTNDAAMVSLLVAAQTLPMFVTMPLAGVMADRLDRRRVMIWTNLLQAVFALGFLLVGRPDQVWLLFAFSVAMVVCEGFFTPASSAAIPNVVSLRHLAAANALAGASWGTMVAVGSAIGGLVAGYWGRSAAFVLNAISFLVAAALVTSVRVPFSSTPSETHAATPGGLRGLLAVTLSDFRDGLRYARDHASALALLLVKCIWGLGGGVLALLSVLPVEVLHAGDPGIGTLYASRGVGALFGPLLARALAVGRPRRMALLAALGVVSSGIFYAAFSLAPTLQWAATFVFIAHLGGGTQWVLSSTLLQRTVADRMRGRVSSLDFAGLTLTMTLSNLACGWCMSRGIAGPRAVGVTAGLLLVVLGAGWIAWYGWLRPPDFAHRDGEVEPEGR